MQIRDFKIVGLDTMIFIYFFQGNNSFAASIKKLLESIEQGQVKGITTVITLSEILVKPLAEGNIEMADEYKNVVNSFPHLNVLEINQHIAVIAASLKAKYGIKLPDALQIAGALFGGSRLFITNDKKLKKIEELRVVTLEQL